MLVLTLMLTLSETPQVRQMFQEMDEALYEDCRLRFEDDEVCEHPSMTCMLGCCPAQHLLEPHHAKMGKRGIRNRLRPVPAH
jgi:hypothetical protein